MLFASASDASASASEGESHTGRILIKVVSKSDILFFTQVKVKTGQTFLCNDHTSVYVNALQVYIV